MKKKKLLSYKKYRTLRHSTPYIFHLQKNGQYIFYFGAKHTFDPKDPQYKKINKYWEDFLRVINKNGCLALIEGGSRKVYKTKTQAIRDGGEMSYVTYLGNKSGIKTFSPEPPTQYRYRELLKKFSKKEIAYYDFALVCYQWNRYKKKPNFEKYVNRFLESDKRHSGWKNFDFSLKNMFRIHKKIFGVKFNKNDKLFFRDILDPIGNKSVINKISLFEESIRDEYIVQKIEELWKKGKNLFVIYGASHTVRQEGVIRDFVSRSY
ncbi:MAG: hypothetical protein A3A98_01405 [Candidatus Staskawiczbacteria bacterium RIFCSPLOWO2_01_FULL_40_39]|nr:MAG: hypothetical protein A3A98_01405 [Candidatus Staskawiczbacteria bacterium RIFCSPLOWO2_01_FULL_40_39]